MIVFLSEWTGNSKKSKIKSKYFAFFCKLWENIYVFYIKTKTKTKTKMRKQIFFIILSIFIWFSSNQTFWNWYGNHAVSYSNPGGAELSNQGESPTWPNKWTICPWDGDWDWDDATKGAVAKNNDSSTTEAHWDNEDDVAESWTMYCLYWDWENPSWSTSYSPDIWTNSWVTVNITCSDTWWSWCDMTYTNTWWTISGNIYSKTFTENTISSITVEDVAWNIWTASYSVANIDITGPTWSTSYSPDIWTNSWVTVNITCSDTWWSWCDMTYTNTWWTISGNIYSKTFTENTTWTITLIDNVWNETTATYDVDNIDKILPSWDVSYSPDIWTNSWVTVSITCSDEWWSWCDMYNISWWSISWNTYSKTFTENTSSSITVKDNAWNETSVSYVITNIDTTAPTIDDIKNLSHTDDSNILANSSENVSFEVWINWWSPIVSIDYSFENYNDKNSSSTGTVNSWSFSEDLNMQDVDRDRETDGSRQYTLTIDKICDEAWNCSSWNNVATYNYNVYANTENIASTITSNILTVWKIADWIPYELWTSLEDNYWNQIVTASWISRTIDLKFNTSNSLYLNQYNNLGNAILANTWSSNIYSNLFSLWDNKDKEFNNFESSDWQYPLNFKVYAPTINWNNFTINQIFLDVNWNIWDIYNKPLIENPIKFNFSPAYEIEFRWNQKDNWFIEWVTQTWSVQVIKTTSKTTSINKISLEQTWTDTNYENFNWTWSIDSWTEYTFNKWWKKVFYNNSSEFKTSEMNFDTLFTLDPDKDWFIDQAKDIVVNAYLEYVIDTNKTVIYKAWTIWWNQGQNSNTIKIYGLTNIDESKQKDLVENQEQDIKNIAWDIDKWELRWNIRKNAFEVIKNVSWSPTWTSLINWKVIYYDYRNANSKIHTINSCSNCWEKTIVILWANAYITWNLTIWWIIVLKDDNNNWWNIYIDPEVRKIGAALYADKSAISYNDIWWEISPSNGWTYEVLKNQLYIHWSLFSENTIWWSRKNPPVCPFYKYSENSFDCTLDEAQKYDLNYLRRWIEENNFGSSEEESQYPVVIKYNPEVQISPPPLFTK